MRCPFTNHRLKEILLAREIEIDSPFRDTGLGGDIIESGLGIAKLTKEIQAALMSSCGRASLRRFQRGPCFS